MLMAMTAGYYKQLCWHKNLTLLSIAFLIFCFPHLVNLVQGTTDFHYVKKAIRVLPLLIITAFLLKNKPHKKSIYLAFMLGLIICFIGMLHAQLTGLDRQDVLGYNSIPLMIAAVAILSFVLPQSNSHCTLLKFSVYLTFTLTVATVVLSQSKGAALSLLAVVFIFSVLSFPKSIKNIVILWLLLFMSAGLTTQLTNNALINRINAASKNITTHLNKTTEHDNSSLGTSSKDRVAQGSTAQRTAPTVQVKSGRATTGTSSTIRMELWKGALLLTAEKPIFGYGKIAARSRMQELIAEGKIASYVKPFTQVHFHSIYFEALGTQGLTGLFAVLFVLLTPLYIFIKDRANNPKIALSGILIIVNYAIAGLGDTALSSTLPTISYFMLMVLCVSQITAPKQRKDQTD